MTIKFTLQKPINLTTLLRQAGYHPITDHNAQQTSWVRTLGRGYYPRFHLHTNYTSANQLELELHLDQKQTTTQFVNKRHASEYSGTTVEQESDRMKRWLQYAQI